MKDVMVSVRMPKPLLQALKQSAHQNNFLDLSEHIRSIVRKQWKQQSNPTLTQLQSVSSQIESQLKTNTEQKVQQEVVKELEKIRNALQNN